MEQPMESRPAFESRINLEGLLAAANNIKSEVGKVIIGQHDMVELLLTALLANGHVLLQGVPGVAKTLSAKLLAKTLDISYSRIQFTPDLMPSDVIGVSVYNNKSGNFEFKQGPIFGNIILIDEINRAPAKTQAALFEVMEERHITVDGERYMMPPPFIVLATQNPIEQEGTYRLPEAQLDRFLFLINIDYPTLEDEINILAAEQQSTIVDKLNHIQAMLTGDEIIHFQSLVQQVQVEPHLLSYIANIIHATRNNPFLYLGASPRASIAILKASKAYAAIRGRDFITPEDIQKIVTYVLEHRIMVQPEKEMEGVTARQIIQQIVHSVAIPR